MSIEKILIVDDELLIRDFLSEALLRKKFDVFTAQNGQKAIAMFKDHSFDLVITDMQLPDLTGIEVLKKIKELSPHTLVVVVTGFGSIENAVETMRLGAFDYLIKPFSPDTIEVIIEKAQAHYSLLQENQYLRQQLSIGNRSSHPIIAESPSMKRIMKEVINVAQSNASVFIHGESGTGKEVIAHAIHHHSQRANRPFIKVNCAAIPETLIESEFFGHEKGAFTGANARRLGRFELANTGTLLLDEITETPTSLQSKLLRVVQEHEFERVGGAKPIKVDVRLISTSNRNMKEAIAQKLLREDLYYRLDVIPIYLPPLRERKEDIIPLAEYFLEKVATENHREPKTLNDKSREILLNYNWPGNIRELANIIERAVVMDMGKEITPAHLLIEQHAQAQITQQNNSMVSFPQGMTLQDVEKQLIIETLQAKHNNRTKAAQALGISVSSLRSKLQKYEHVPN